MITHDLSYLQSEETRKRGNAETRGARVSEGERGVPARGRARGNTYVLWRHFLLLRLPVSMRPFRSVPLLLKLLPLLLLRVQRLLRRLARLCLLAGLGGTAGLARFVGLPLIRAHHTDQPIIPTRPPRLRRPASGHVRREGRSKENRSRKDSHRLVQHGTVCMHSQVLLCDLILDTDTDTDTDIDIVTPIQSH